MRLLAVGLALTAAVTGVLWLVWDGAAVVPGVTFGLLATGIQLAAVAIMRPVAGAADFANFAKRWGVGMGLRLGGVVVFATLVLVDRTVFPPLPSAFAYVAVIVPLLFMETRFLR